SVKTFKKWPADLEAAGNTAQYVYEGLKAFNPVSLSVAAARYNDWAFRTELEEVIWYDRATGLLINAQLCRRLRENEELKQRLIETFRREVKKGRQFVASPDFTESKVTYAIERPEDIGPLVRNKVTYS